MTFIWENFVLAIIAFAVLYWLLSRYAFGPLMNVMEARKERVLSEMKNAETSRQEAERFLAEQREALEAARKEAYEIIEQAKQMSAKQAAEILDEAKAEAQRIKDQALRDIANEKEKAIASVRDQVGALSVLIAAKIIEKQLDEKTHEQLIDQYLKEVGDVVQ